MPMALISRISARRDRERMDSLVLLAVLVTCIGLGLTATGSRGLLRDRVVVSVIALHQFPTRASPGKIWWSLVPWWLSCALAWD